MYVKEVGFVFCVYGLVHCIDYPFFGGEGGSGIIFYRLPLIDIYF